MSLLEMLQSKKGEEARKAGAAAEAAAAAAAAAKLKAEQERERAEQKRLAAELKLKQANEKLAPTEEALDKAREAAKARLLSKGEVAALVEELKAAVNSGSEDKVSGIEEKMKAMSPIAKAEVAIRAAGYNIDYGYYVPAKRKEVPYESYRSHPGFVVNDSCYSGLEISSEAFVLSPEQYWSGDNELLLLGVGVTIIKSHSVKHYNKTKIFPPAKESGITSLEELLELVCKNSLFKDRRFDIENAFKEIVNSKEFCSDERDSLNREGCKKYGSKGVFALGSTIRGFLKERLEELQGFKAGIVIIDNHGRPCRSWAELDAASKNKPGVLAKYALERLGELDNKGSKDLFKEFFGISQELLKEWAVANRDRDKAQEEYRLANLEYFQVVQRTLPITSGAGGPKVQSALSKGIF